MAPRTSPPFRADHVGSYLRTTAIHEARARRDAGELSADELREVEDREIAALVRKQEDIGLQAATDGEFRRSWWHFDFFGMLDGVEIRELDHGIQFQGVQTKPRGIVVTGPIRFSPDHPMLDHFRYLAATTNVVPKMTIPAPTVMHFRIEDGSVDGGTYPERDDILGDLAAADRDAVREGVRDGTLDVIATDHAPHHYDEKEQAFEDAPNGIVGLETALGLVLTQLVGKGVIDLPTLVERMSCAPARALSLPGGTLRPGSAADVTLFHPDAEWTVDPARFLSMSRNTPFRGWTLRGRPVRTIVGGRTVWERAAG